MQPAVQHGDLSSHRRCDSLTAYVQELLDSDSDKRFSRRA